MTVEGTSAPAPAGSARAWLRLVVIAMALAFGVWLLVVAAGRSETGLEQGSGDPVVAQRFPPPDAQAPSQSQIGITLQPGYEGSLTVGGVTIPEEELDGALDPATADPQLIRERGIRPNNRNRVWFTPGTGKVFEELPVGELVITVSYHREHQPAVDPGAVSWVVTIV